jgi:hypothetical protein
MIGNITIASWKTNLKNNEYYNNAEVSNDILSSQRDRVWASTAAQFFNNKLDDVVTHYSYEKNPKFEITFDRVIGSGYGGIPPSNPEIIAVSHQNLKVGIRGNV